ncbi:MAG: hypothetical protein HFJ40_02575 [Clostridia bacterium]|nr:hypothetical protein [Clostridia bacterium]
MRKPIVKAKYNNNMVIVSECPENELIELISLACCYNGEYNYYQRNNIFKVQCYSIDATENLRQNYFDYFFSK